MQAHYTGAPMLQAKAKATITKRTDANPICMNLVPHSTSVLARRPCAIIRGMSTGEQWLSCE